MSAADTGRDYEHCMELQRRMADNEDVCFGYMTITIIKNKPFDGNYLSVPAGCGCGRGTHTSYQCFRRSVTEGSTGTHARCSTSRG